MNTTRLWALGSIVVVFALLVGTWFVGIQPQLADASASNAERESVEGQNQLHEATLASLKKQFENIDELREELEESRKQVPPDADTSALLRNLFGLATKHKVVITSLSLAAPAPYIPPAEEVSDPELGAAMGSVSPENFLAIGLEVGVSGKYSQVMNFMAALQTGERVTLISDFAMPEGIPSGGTAIETNFSGEIFVLLSGQNVDTSDQPDTPVGEDGAEGDESTNK